MNRFRSLVLVCLAITFGVLVGCGGARRGPYPATGEIVYRGTPLVNAQVTFVPSEGQGRMSRGSTDANGRFELSMAATDDGAMAGEHQVLVVKVVPAAPAKGDSSYGPMKSAIPELYGSATTSPLKATVAADAKNHFRFELVD